LNRNGRIAGLWFGTAETLGSIADLAGEIQALPGTTALLVISDGKDVVAHAAEQSLAVGSAAKLAILVAVRNAVEQGKLRWDQVVPLDPAWKSLPSGQLQDWPDGTPLTLATLANLMISVSDNTATDALVRIVGREAVEAVSPSNAPFPTTRELFTLKTTANAPRRAEWLAGNEDARRAILARIADEPLPSAAAITSDITSHHPRHRMVLYGAQTLPSARPDGGASQRRHQSRPRQCQGLEIHRLQGRLGTGRAQPFDALGGC
jgi:beta-lactamase class A